MKRVLKKSLLTIFCSIFAVCGLCLAATAVSNKVQVNADDAAVLKAEFTNDGEFEIKTSAHSSALSYVDGTTVGGTGAVLKVGYSVGVNTFRLDLTPMKVTKADVTSIVVKIKATNFTKGSDEFRTFVLSNSSWRQYGKTDDLSDWFSYTLNANSMADFTVNSDGTMGYNDIGIRTNTSSLFMYVDSVTVNVRDTSGMEMQTFSSVFNNASYNSLTRALLTYSGTATWDNTDYGNLKYKITLKNSSTGDSILYANCGSSITHWTDSVQRWANVALPGTYDTIIIAEGAHFGGVKIPSGTLTWNTSTSKWDQWDGDIELTYGTPTLSARTSGVSDNGYGWNHKTDNAAVVKNSDYGYTIGVFSKVTAHSTNLAATKNVTSLSITLNGVSFYELYKQDDGYRLNAQLSYFGFSVPTAALVGGNGYDVPTVEIHKGTPFYENYLPAAKIIYTDGSWRFTTPVNYDLDFVSINNSFNNDANGFFIAQFDTYEWAQNATPTSYRGIKFNGKHIGDLTTNIKFFGTSSVWFTYTVQASNPKLAAGYNDYSHPTIEFEEGATMVYSGHTYTFHAVKFYLNLETNKWQTEVPDGYSVGSIEVADFAGVWGNADGYNSSTTLLLQYATTGEWDYTDKGTLASCITYRNSSTSATFSPTDSNIAGWDGNKWIVLNGLSGYDTIEITAGGTFGGVEIPAGTFYLVNGRWVDTALQAANTNYTAMADGWNNSISDGSSRNILRYDVSPLGDAADATNLAATLSRTSLMVKYNGSTFFDLYSDTSNANRTKYVISYAHSSRYVYITIPEADLFEGATIEVEAGTPFKNYYLGAVTLYYFNGYWVTEAPHAANATFSSMPAIWNNFSSNDASCNILTYSVNPLGDAANSTNLAATINRTSLMVKYNGATFYELYADTSNANRAKYRIDYEHGNGHFYFTIPEADLVEGATLVVEDGTPFMNYYLEGVTLYYFHGYWVTSTAHAANTIFTGFESDAWNNSSSSGSSCSLLNYNVNPLGAAASVTNLAATINRTSLMVKYNGVAFYDLYSDTSNANRTKYVISYAHGTNRFYFTIPEADLVDGAELEIEDGTPFMNYYLEGVTLTYNATSGKWEFPVNYKPTFVSINSSYNNDSNGFFIAQFNTTGWAQSQVPTSYSGITYNGNSITDLTTNIKFYMEHSVWFTYTAQASNPKLNANYNGYSHPTIAFAEGATMVYGGNTYTFHAVTFYLNLSTNKWQTEVPAGYVVRNALNYSSVNASYNNNKNIASGYSCTLIQFSGTIGSYTGTNIASTLGAYISVGGETLDNISGAVLQIGYNGSYTNCLFVKVPVSALVIDNTSKVVELSIADYITGDTVLCGVDLYLVDGVWVTSYSATIRTFVGELWQCNDYSQNYELTSYIGRDNVFALLNYDVYIFDGVETTVYTNYITAINDVGNKIKINGTTPLKDEPLAKVYLLNAHMVIAVPSCDYVTIEEGTYFLGQLLGAATIYYTGGTWESSDPSAEAVEMHLAATSQYIEIAGVRWNNFDYNGYGVTLGYENSTGIPANGMVLLLEFAESSLVDQPNRTSWANQIGAYSKVGNGFKINGVSLKNVSNAYVGFMLGGNKLYVYIPFDSIDEADFYTFTVDADTEILYSTLPAITLYFYDRVWHDVAPKALVINYAAESISINKRIGSSVTVNSDYLTEVLSSRLENAIVLAWTIGGNDYFYGDSSTLSVSATITITSLVDFYTVDGASVRMAADGNTGLRFESRIRNADLEALISTYDSVELGTYIAPRYMIDNYLSTNPSNTFKDYFAQAQGSGNATKYLKIANVNASGNVGIYNRNTYESDGYIRYFGSMVNIYDVNYYTKFVGIGYIKIVKGGNTYIVFGATSLSKITRTVYDVVKAAYSDTTVPYTVTQLNTLAGFMNEVCDLSFRNGNLSINNTVTGRNYTPAYSSSVNGGVCYIARSASVKMPGVIVINGKKVSVSNFIDNTQSGYLILAITSSNMSALFNDGIVYGIGEPCIDLWPNNNTVATAEMLATIADEMNATAFRIWLQGEFASVNSSNEVSLNSSLANALENYIGQLVSHGVKEIYLMGLKYMPAKDYPTYYCTNKSTSTNEWISVNTFGDGSNYTLLCYDINCVPDPSTEAEAYATWLKIQYDAYDLLTSSIASWKTEHSWADDVKFYFEGLNEPEGQTTVHKRGVYSAGVYLHTYFNNTELAKIHTDVAYYMTLAVNDNLSGIGFVTTPALTNLTTTCGNGIIQSGVYVDTLLTAMAAAIKDNVAPTAIDGITPVNTTDPEDYFTVLNWHPYLSWWKDENADIYYGEIKTTKTWYGSTTTEGVVNADYVSQWVNWNNNIYHLFVDQFNNYTPKVVFSEFGAMDYGTDYASNQRWTKLGINETLAGQVFYNLVTAIENTDFKANCTVLGFRMCDTESLILADQGGVHNLYSAGEGNIGFIEENGIIKATMKKYYYIINGSNDTSALQTVVSSFYD